MHSMKRFGAGVVVAVALAGAAAGQAGAAAINGPGCTARLVPAPVPVGTASCGFDSPTDWSTINVVPTGQVTATVRCNNFGYMYTTTRSGSERFSFIAHTPGTCSLSLSSSSGAGAVATSTPTIPPICCDPQYAVE
jgi:hypothetical protein